MQRLVINNCPQPEDARRLSPNGRAHWRARNIAGNNVAWQVMAAIRAQAIQPMRGRVHLQARFVFPVHRRRDQDNWTTGTLKRVIDCLVRQQILEDDSTAYLLLAPVQVVVEPGERRLELELREGA